VSITYYVVVFTILVQGLTVGKLMSYQNGKKKPLLERVKK
jgi:NhaP-type Na+/H+ or K+/H+ antiporter